MDNVTIDGGGYSFTGSSGHSLVVSKRRNGVAPTDVTIKNMGSYTDGSDESSTFSFTDLSGNTISKTITKSVNSFPQYFLTVNQPVTLNVENSAFLNNTARLIILGVGQTLNLKNSIFYNNTSTGDSLISHFGAVNAINIENSIFYNNTNTNSDAAVVSTSSPLTIKNSYFINNSSGDDGGAISYKGDNILIENTLFKGNTARIDGGAIAMYTNAGLVVIKNSDFVGNKNKWSDGGAISTGGGYIKSIENAVFEDNFAYSSGGAIWLAVDDTHSEKAPILLKDVTLKNNEGGDSGALFLEGEGDGRKNATYIANSEFTGNIATPEDHDLDYGIPIGGAILTTGGIPVTISNTTFSENKASDDNGYSAGGAIYFASDSADYPLTLVDTSFTNNSAFEGVAIYVDNADTLIITQAKDVM